MMELGMFTDSSGEQSCVSFWNISTGVIIKSYKNGACGKNCIGFIRNDYVVTGQHGKQLIHIYDAHKEYLLKKIVCPGKISALAVSPDGNYCVVALVEKIFIWQISSGNLINILSKHYQNVSSIKFTRDGSFFITCGDDNLLLIWNFASVLQPREKISSSNVCEQPFHTLSQHSMAIKGVYVGVGGLRCHVLTCSIDNTCKLFDLCSGKLLCSLIFDEPCTAVTMDTSETQIFTGTIDGKIYFVNCYMQTNEKEVHVQSEQSVVLQAHDKEIVSLSVCMDGTKLISGSLDCVIKLWHINSRQCLRAFSFKGEITNASIIPYPIFLRENTTPSTKLQLMNFKRSVYVPVQNANDTDEACDTIPVVQKNINKEDLSMCYLPTSDDHKNTCSDLEQVLLECTYKNNTSNMNSLKTATRPELIEKIASLENMAQQFYKLASDKLLKDIK